MKLLSLSVILLTAFSYSEIKVNDTELLKVPQIEHPIVQKPIVFVPNLTCKLEVIELEGLTMNDKIKTCIKKDHSWLKI